MGWQSYAPSLPSGSSYSRVGSASLTANHYKVTVYIDIARLSENQVSIRFSGSSSAGSYGDYNPPPKSSYKVGNSTVNKSWCSTWYWVGTLNAGATVTVQTGATSYDTPDTAFSHKTYVTATATGPAYVTTYAISYNGNGSTSGSTSGQTKNYNQAITLRNNGFTRTGYTFVCWNTKANGTGTDYAPGASYTANADVTLYAKWQINTWPVTYNGNGNTGGSTASQTKTYGEDLTLRQNGFTRKYYTFVEWNTKADGTGVSYAPGETYSTNAALTLYAIWKRDITIYLNVDGVVKQVDAVYMNVDGQIKQTEAAYMNVGGVVKQIGG